MNERVILSKLLIFDKALPMLLLMLLTSISNSYALAANSNIAQSSANIHQFPLRSHFSSVITISHQELAKRFDDMLIIDVRSAYEFQVLHINNAINVPITNLGFIPTLKVLRANDNREIVFYCNGTTCEKSYIANSKAQQNNIQNIFTFDLGILAWSQKHPDKATFFGDSPLAVNKLISTKKFDMHNLSPKEFVNKIDNNALVIDIREPFQRDITILGQESILVPLNNFHRILATMQKKNATLLIYDAVGKQVKWLQYLLEKQGIKNYYFMKGGVRAYAIAGLN